MPVDIWNESLDRILNLDLLTVPNKLGKSIQGYILLLSGLDWNFGIHDIIPMG